MKLPSRCAYTTGKQAGSSPCWAHSNRCHWRTVRLLHDLCLRDPLRPQKAPARQESAADSSAKFQAEMQSISIIQQRTSKDIGRDGMVIGKRRGHMQSMHTALCPTHCMLSVWKGQGHGWTHQVTAVGACRAGMRRHTKYTARWQLRPPLLGSTCRMPPHGDSLIPTAVIIWPPATCLPPCQTQCVLAAMTTSPC